MGLESSTRKEIMYQMQGYHTDTYWYKLKDTDFEN